VLHAFVSCLHAWTLVVCWIFSWALLRHTWTLFLCITTIAIETVNTSIDTQKINFHVVHISAVAWTLVHATCCHVTPWLTPLAVASGGGMVKSAMCHLSACSGGLMAADTLIADNFSAHVAKVGNLCGQCIRSLHVTQPRLATPPSHDSDITHADHGNAPSVILHITKTRHIPMLAR
jgi:hypothetical protein